MKILISPAKSLDWQTPLPTRAYSQNVFLEKAKVLMGVLKNKTPAELERLMGISKQLSLLNHQRNQEWQLPFTPKNARPAMYSFSGAVYQGFNVFTLQPAQQNFLQKHLRIISGLYGILKPLDLIQPYRLEMGTKLAFGGYKNLYDFWKEILTSHLNEELKIAPEKKRYLVHLASEEYFRAVDCQKVRAKIIQPIFKDYKNGRLRTIAFYAKKTRGLMLRFIVEQAITAPEEIKNFQGAGYVFQQSLSNDTQWIFTRNS